ncbi:WXG100 family type VII secretion target [Streptomyces collinus]|uniref:WXG100 family type VII secretion target n=1 Tax=Streptomyces collinus TaxID=42684 RepID=UPI003431D41B
MTDKHEDDLKRVDSQNNVTDFVRGVEEGPQGWFVDGIVRSAVNVTPYGRAVAARTDFEKRDLDLNEMIDLVEQTDPEDLESSGKALWDARDAIKKAADDLNGHIDKVEWVGQAGQAFRTWGRNLVTNTHHLSEFAGAAGDQITAAAVGLASVRGAMPARDSHPSRKRPEKFTTAEKAANKEDYAAAVKVEKERQEAINQMNRLSSYYAVSEEVLSALPAKGKTPEFASMPDVGVPRPQQVHEGGRSVSGAGSGSGSHVSTGSGGTSIPSAHHAAVPGDVGGHVPNDVPAHTKHVPEQLPHTDQPVGTNIDSTGTLPPPTTTTPAPGHTPPVTGTPPTSGGQPPVFEGPMGTPIPNRASGRGLSGAGGYRTPPSAQGRAGTSGVTNPGSGRAAGQGPLNQMGRATSTGQLGAKGTASGSKSLPMGRGVTGGTPRPGGTAAPRAAGGPATGAGRSNGVVGGRPTATGGATSKGGARIPRGTVIGGEEAANSRGTTGRLGQRGVFGASEPTARPGANTAGPRSAGGASEAVTGRPTARNSAAGAERNGLTRGGSGLVRGPGRNGKPGDEEEAQGSERPDYLVEDEETHLPDKPRRDVPPVVN